MPCKTQGVLGPELSAERDSLAVSHTWLEGGFSRALREFWIPVGMEGGHVRAYVASE